MCGFPGAVPLSGRFWFFEVPTGMGVCPLDDTVEDLLLFLFFLLSPNSKALSHRTHPP